FLYFAQPYDGDLYILTNEDSPHFRVFKTPVTTPAREHWREIIPQSDSVLKELHIIGGQLFVLYEQNAHSLLRRFTTQGKPLGEVELPTLGTIVDIGGDYDSTSAFYLFTSFTVPTTIYRFDIQTAKNTLWDSVPTGIDTNNYETRQVWYTSKDGTRVPMFLVMRKGVKLTGHNPAMLTAYGGFNGSLTPEFSKVLFPGLDHDGVFAMANLRGGSEFGEDWHRAGMLAKKQNVFDDFIAAGEYLSAQKYTDKDHLAIQGGSNGGLLMGAMITQRPDLFRAGMLEKKQNVFDDFIAAGEYLIAQKYADRDHLAIFGGSNGGLLMGAMITQRPDLFRAVVCAVPLLDMLRYQNFQIAKLWIPEYGSAEDAKQFDWLYAYSPYHHVKPGQEYPAILLMTGDTDTRVDPMHAKKMAALMQAEAKNGACQQKPILLRIETKAGHGQGKHVTKQIEESTDMYSFLFWQLGVKP